MFQRNRVEITGNIGKTAKHNAGGRGHGDARAAHINDETIHRDGRDPIEMLTAVDIEIWGRRGKAFARYMTTKTPVYIEGRLQLDEWEKVGDRFFRLLVHVTDWQFLAPKPNMPTLIRVYLWFSHLPLYTESALRPPARLPGAPVPRRSVSHRVPGISP